MNIVVCIKQIIDPEIPSAEFKVDFDAKVAVEDQGEWARIRSGQTRRERPRRRIEPCVVFQSFVPAHHDRERGKNQEYRWLFFG